MEFSIRAFYSRGEAISDAVQARLNGDLTGSFAQYFSNIDFSKFRPGVDPAQLLRMLTWMTEGYMNEKQRAGVPLHGRGYLADYSGWEGNVPQDRLQGENIYGRDRAFAHHKKDYGGGHGVFDVSFAVEQGEVFGFLGPNGAGKTTTIRQLMGFLAPDSGTCTINGLDCRTETAAIQKNMGYIPGEPALPDDIRGGEFIRFLAAYRGMRGTGRAGELCERFELDASGRIRRMSKGMKQKVAIVCALMHDPAVLILDEPTSGLDPLMPGTKT